MFKPPSTFPTPPFLVVIKTSEEWDIIKNYLHNKGIEWRSSGSLESAYAANVSQRIHSRFNNNSNDKLVLYIGEDLRLNGSFLTSSTPSLFSNGSMHIDVTEQFHEEEKPLTNEEIFVTFLKHHRKLAPFKRNREQWCNRRSIIDESESQQVFPIDKAILRAFEWSDASSQPYVWRSTNTKWGELVKKFRLKGSIDFREVLKMR